MHKCSTSRLIVVPAEVGQVQPHLGWIKCNIDGGFFANKGVATMADWQASLSTMEGELVHFWERCKRLLIKVLIVFCETDSQILVDAIWSNRRGNWVHSLIVCNSVMSSFINFKVKLIRRQMNMVAYTFARPFFELVSIILKIIKPCIEHVLIYDESWNKKCIFQRFIPQIGPFQNIYTLPVSIQFLLKPFLFIRIFFPKKPAFFKDSKNW